MLSQKQKHAISQLPGIIDGNRWTLEETLEDGGILPTLVEYFQQLGHAGITPFSLAGITGESPRRVMRKLTTTSAGDGLDMFYCSYTGLPVISPGGWKSGREFLRNYHQEDLEGEFFEDDEEIERHSLPTMMKKYGGVGWKRHCTREFNPFCSRTAKHFTPKQWAAAKALAASCKRKRKPA